MTVHHIMPTRRGQVPDGINPCDFVICYGTHGHAETIALCQRHGVSYLKADSSNDLSYLCGILGYYVRCDDQAKHIIYTEDAGRFTQLVSTFIDCGVDISVGS